MGRVGAVGTEEVLAGAHPGVRVLGLASHRPRTQVNLAQSRAFEQVRVGGRLATYAEAWRVSLWDYGCISKGLVWQWERHPPRLKLFYQEPTPLLQSFAETLLESNAIERTRQLSFQGPLFSVPKKGTDKRRVILDLSTLNRYISRPRFKMTTVEQVRQVLPAGAWTISLDLSEAYYHVPIHPDFRKFLGFRLGTQKYRFRALPFGLNIAPGVFTRLTNVIVSCLREKGVCAVAYLDAWLVWADSHQACVIARDVVMLELESRGFWSTSESLV